MSKTFSMPGWRMGFAVGNERLISALTRVKSYLDYGAFTPIQVAAAHALNGDGADIAEVRDIYKRRRRDGRQPSAAPAGPFRPPAASMFAWAPIPEKFRISARSNSPSCWSSMPTWPWRPVSASASMATITCASRWSRTSTAFARRRATSSVPVDAPRNHAQRRLAERSPVSLPAAASICLSGRRQDDPWQMHCVSELPAWAPLVRRWLVRACATRRRRTDPPVRPRS
jgi:hypothetical protein